MGAGKTAVILGLLSLLTLPTVLATNITVKEDPDLLEFEGLIEKKLVEFLSTFEGLHIPAIPTTLIEYEDLVSVAFSMNNIVLSGVSNVTVKEFTHHTKNPGSQLLTLVFPWMSITVGDYISAGHLITLPMNGEGPMSLTLYELSINLTFDWDKYSLFNHCAAENSTKFSLDVHRTQINFENLNPGTDQGQLINIMLSSFGPDIVDYLELLLNTSLNGPIDDALISLVNHLCFNSKEDDTLDLHVSDAAHFMEDLLQSILRDTTDLNKSKWTVNGWTSDVQL